MNPVSLYALFAVVASLEIYFFLMQRLPLEVAREQGIEPRIAREMLPTWYALVWLAKLGKWVLVFLIWRASGWLPALVALAIPFFASTFIRVPYTHIANICQRTLEGGSSQNPIAAIRALNALKASREKNGY